MQPDLVLRPPPDWDPHSGGQPPLTDCERQAAREAVERVLERDIVRGREPTGLLFSDAWWDQDE